MVQLENEMTRFEPAASVVPFDNPKNAAPAIRVADEPTLVGILRPAPAQPLAKGSPTEGLSARTVRGLTGFLDLEPAWRELLERVKPQNPFLSWEWVSEWGHSYWDDRLIVVVIDGPTGPVAMAPFYPTRGALLPGLRAPGLALMGPRRQRRDWLFELAEPLVDPSFAIAAFRLILCTVSQIPGCHWVEVAGLGKTKDWWRQAAADPTLRTALARVHCIDVPIMSLAPTWEETRRKLRRNIKESIRRAYNAPARAGIQLKYVEHRGGPQLGAVIDDFFSLHAARADPTGRAPHYDYFADRRARDLIRRAALRLAEANRLSVGTVEVEGIRVAARLHFETNGTLYLYQSGFDPRFWEYSVSLYGAVEAIKASIGRHLTHVNFSLGVDQAKARWDVEMVPYERLWLVRNSRISRSLLKVQDKVRRMRARVRATRYRLRRAPPAPRSTEG